MDYLPTDRITLKEALKHPFFRPIKKQYPGRYPSIDQSLPKLEESPLEEESKEKSLSKEASASDAEKSEEKKSEYSSSASAEMKEISDKVEKIKEELGISTVDGGKISEGGTISEAVTAPAIEQPTDSGNTVEPKKSNNLLPEPQEEPESVRFRRSKNLSPETPRPDVITVDESESVQEARRARRQRRAEREAKLAAEKAAEEQSEAAQARRERRARRAAAQTEKTLSEDSKSESEALTPRQTRKLKRADAVNDDFNEPEVPATAYARKLSNKTEKEPEVTFPRKLSNKMDDAELPLAAVHRKLSNKSDKEEDLLTRLARKALKAELEKNAYLGESFGSDDGSSKASAKEGSEEKHEVAKPWRARMEEIEREVAEEEARETEARKARKDSKHEVEQLKPEPSMKSIFEFFKKSTPEKKISIYPELSSAKNKSASPAAQEDKNVQKEQKKCDREGHCEPESIGCGSLDLGLSNQVNESKAPDLQAQLGEIMVTPPTPTTPVKFKSIASIETESVGNVTSSKADEVPVVATEVVQDTQHVVESEDTGVPDNQVMSEPDSEEFQSVAEFESVPEGKGETGATSMDSGDDVFLSEPENMETASSPSPPQGNNHVKPRDYSMVVESGPCQIYLEPEPPDITQVEEPEVEEKPQGGKRRKSRKKK